MTAGDVTDDDYWWRKSRTIVGTYTKMSMGHAGVCQAKREREKEVLFTNQLVSLFGNIYLRLFETGIGGKCRKGKRKCLFFSFRRFPVRYFSFQHFPAIPDIDFNLDKYLHNQLFSFS